MTYERLPSLDAQKQALKKKGVIIGRARTPRVVNRLYRYYIRQHHPASDPRDYAYGMQKRVEQRIETTEKPEKMMVATGTGKRVQVKSIIRKQERMSIKEFERALPPNVTFHYGKTFRTVDKIRDYGSFEIIPPIRASVITIDKARKRAELVTKEIIEVIHIAQRIRQRFYKNYDVGGKIIAKGHNFEKHDKMVKNPPIIVALPWTGLHRPDEYFHMMLMEQGFEEVFQALYAKSAQDKASVTISRVELKFTTDKRPSNIDRMRSK